VELDSRIIRAELRRDADKISLMRRSIRELRARLSLGRGKHAKAIQRRAVLKGALNLLTDDNKNSFRFYLCTSLGIIKPGYRGTVGDKLANGWTKLTHSCCRKNWTQATAQKKGTQARAQKKWTPARAQTAKSGLWRESSSGSLELIATMLIAYAATVRRSRWLCPPPSFCSGLHVRNRPFFSSPTHLSAPKYSLPSPSSSGRQCGQLKHTLLVLPFQVSLTL
jgi:hypothetical protein